MEKILEIRNLNKSFAKKHVVNDVSFDVTKGEILCLLGPNGAGKSTIINMICGLLGYDSGTILYKGQNIKKNITTFKKNLGVIPQDIALYEDLSTYENIKFFASLYGLRGKELEAKVEHALDFVGLLNKKKDIVKTFSGGMKRRLNIACSITHEPEFIIMDEPTVGIDPQSRNFILQSIVKLSQKGTTVLYTTHYMEEVEEISSAILIIDMGKIIAEGTNEALKENFFKDKEYIIEISNDQTIILEDFYKIEGVKHVSYADRKINISVLKHIENLDKIIATIIANDSKILNISSKLPSLENLFLHLTGKKLRD